MNQQMVDMIYTTVSRIIAKLLFLEITKNIYKNWIFLQTKKTVK